jgi:hypothetical protein
MKKYIVSCCLALGVISCGDDFLEMTPESALTDVAFYKTEEHFNQAIAAAYSSLRDVVSANTGTVKIGGTWNINEMRSDNTHYDYNATNRGEAAREVIADFVNDYTNTFPAQFYTNAYRGIGRVNTILARIGGASFADDKKTAIIGQAKFLRAIYYFHLVRYFGGVPLFENEVITEQDAYKSRASVDDVYNFIIADAKDAVDKTNILVAGQTGRITKGAAKALLADVYLTRKQYSLAETELRDITAMGYGLLPSYANVFSPSNKNSIESVFEVQFSSAAGQQSNWLPFFVPRTSNAVNVTSVANMNTLIDGGWNVPTEEMRNAYEAGDARENVSIGMAEGMLDASGNNFIPTSLVVKNSDGYVNPGGGVVARPFIRKFMNHSVDNWPVYRYAEILLMLAEALNEQNKTPEAIPYLNQVRTRAGLANTTATSQTDVRAAIWEERRVELAFENKRWFDLIRMPEAEAIAILTAHGDALKATNSNLTAATYQITKDLFIYPIPKGERDLNPEGMTQNPGYVGQ